MFLWRLSRQKSRKRNYLVTDRSNGGEKLGTNCSLSFKGGILGNFLPYRCARANHIRGFIMSIGLNLDTAACANAEKHYPLALPVFFSETSTSVRVFYLIRFDIIYFIILFLAFKYYVSSWNQTWFAEIINVKWSAHKINYICYNFIMFLQLHRCLIVGPFLHLKSF